MMANDTLGCKKEECTFAQTGACVLDNDPETCLNTFTISSAEDLLSRFEAENTSPAQTKHRFTSSYTFSAEQTEKYTAQQYCKVVGILGVPGTGKTACLVSMYLMLAHDKLTKFKFRNSKTLMGFEEICAGARHWKLTDLPETLTTHTEILDERSAGFLHLNLYSKAIDSEIQLLIPDIPGEWTLSLINSNRTDRLAFLKSTECIWIMVNNEHIVSIETRNATLHKLTLMIQRLNSFLSPEKIRLVVVATHIDKYPLNKNLFKKVDECAANYGFPLKIMGVASFSSGTPPAGTGIEELFEDLVNDAITSSPSYWMNLNQQGSRQIMHFGLKKI
jgi:hypothetical protein